MFVLSHLDFRNGSCHFSAHILRSRSNVTVLEFMGPTKYYHSWLLLCVYLILGQFKKMARVHFEALDPTETVLYAWKLSSDMPK